MKKLYQRTFEQVLAQTCPPLNRVEEQRRALASRCSHTESEVTAMTTKPRRPIRILVAAAAVAAALTAGTLAASGALGSISLLSGGAFTSTDSVNWNEPDAGATVAPSQEHVCFPVREEPDLLTVRGGSVYFTTETGEELDITGQFSEAEPYVYSYTASDGSAHDIVNFSRGVLQPRLRTLKLMSYVHQGYVARFQSVSGYFQRSMDLLEPSVRDELFNPDRPIRTKDRSNPSTYYGPDSRSVHSLVADGCLIEGEVENSILFRGVRVEKGAKVQNCILMQGTVIQQGATLKYAITDKNVQVNAGRMLMGHETYPLAIAKNAVV